MGMGEQSSASTSTGPAGSSRRPQKQVTVPEGYMAVGQIIGVHGLRGEVRVDPYSDFPERFDAETVLFLGDDLVELVIHSARPHKGRYLVHFVGLESREDSERLRGQWLFVPEDEAFDLEEDTYWVHDILGLSVVSTDGQLLGTVSDVLFTGANEVYVVQTLPHINGGHELLLPAIADVIQAVDLEEKRLLVSLLPGLLEA